MHQKGQAPQEWERVDVRVLGYRTRTFIFNEGVQLSVVTLAFSPSARGAEAEVKIDLRESTW